MEVVGRKRDMKKHNRSFILLGILFLAFSLRAPIVGMGTLVDYIRQDLGLNASVAGMLTTIPLLGFALLSPLAGPTAGRMGLGRSLQMALCAIAAGILIRSYAGTAGLLLGTVLIGAGIAFGNVLLPAVVKSQYPERIGLMTGVYTTAMNVFASLSTAFSVPLAIGVGLGWRNMLGLWCIPAMAGILIWMPLRKMSLSDGGKRSTVRVWRHKTAWWVALYMGFQSFFYYAFMAWAPTVMAGKGIDPETAGYIYTVYQLMGIPGSLLLPVLLERVKQRVLAVATASWYFVGFILFWAFDGFWLILGMILAGVASGVCFGYNMALMGLRTENPETAAKLSGMSQMVGYCIAAVGPVLLGQLFDLTGSWNAPMLCILIIIVVDGVFGWMASKPGLVK